MRQRIVPYVVCMWSRFCSMECVGGDERYYLHVKTTIIPQKLLILVFFEGGGGKNVPLGPLGHPTKKNIWK